ncbi:hypothetical protein QTN25_010130 [Entamoeba marina]
METVTQSHEFIELKKIMPEIVEMMEKSSVDVQSSINTKFGVEHCFVDPVNETYEEQIKIYEKYYEELVQIADEKEKEILNRTNKENDNSSLLLMLNKLVNYLEESEKSFNQVEIECLELIRTRITEVAGEIDNLREEVFKLNELNLLKKFKEEAALRKKFCLENNALICFGFVDETNFSIQGSPSIESKLNQSDTTDLKINNISDVNSFYKLNGCAYDCQFNFTSPLPSNSLNSAQPQIGVCNALNLTATVKKDVRQPTKFNESSTQPFNMLGGFFGQPTQPESNDKISFKNTRLVILEME